MPRSLREEIARKYWETTSVRSHSLSREYYETSANGLRRRFGRWLPVDREAACLDLGCGCGEMLYLLERMGFRRTVGVNLSKEELDGARPYIKGELVCANVLEYLKNCGSESVDLVCALNFLEHFSKDALFQLMEEIRRVLRPGGALIAMVPNAISPFGTLTRHWDITHEWAFTPNNFRQLTALTGFDSHVEFHEWGPIPHGFVSAVRYCLWQVIRVGIAFRFLVELGSAKGGIYTMDMIVKMRVSEKQQRVHPLVEP